MRGTANNCGTPTFRSRAGIEPSPKDNTLKKMTDEEIRRLFCEMTNAGMTYDEAEAALTAKEPSRAGMIRAYALGSKKVTGDDVSENDIMLANLKENSAKSVHTKARILYDSSPRTDSPKEMVDRFVKELDMSLEIATAHYWRLRAKGGG